MVMYRRMTILPSPARRKMQKKASCDAEPQTYRRTVGRVKGHMRMIYPLQGVYREVAVAKSIMVDSLRTLDVVFIAVSDSAVGNIFFKGVLVELGRDHVTVAVDASERLRDVKEEEVITLGGTKLCFIKVPKAVVHLSRPTSW